MNTGANDTSAAHTALDTAFQSPDYEQWLESATRGLGEARSLIDNGKQTLDGIAIAALYDSCPATQSAPATTVGAPWDNRLSLQATSTPENTNLKILQGLSGGNTSIELHASSPMQLESMLAGVDLTLAALSVRVGMQFAECAQQLIELINKQSISLQNCPPGFNADPLGCALKNGGLAVPMDVALEQMVGFSQSVSQTLPGCKTILVDGAAHHNAGASPVEELHATIATATLYLEQLLNAGANAADALQQISFQLALDSDMLIGLAKIRAFDQLWSHVARQLTGDNSLVVSANPVAETSRRVISSLDPWNNHLRNLAACMTAAMAGTPAIIVHPHDDNEPALAARMARNLPIIVEREAGLRNVSNPLAGSYAIESLTQNLIDKTWQSLQATDTSMQWQNQIQSGQWQARLADTHARRLALIDSEQKVMVGVNRYRPATMEPNTVSATGNAEQITAVRNTAQQYPVPVLSTVRDAQNHEHDPVIDGATP